MFSRIIDAKFGLRCGTTRILPAEDAFQAAANGPENALHSALHALFDVALVDCAQARWDIVALFEVLHVGWTPFNRP
jgi:hypothetical protein